MTVTRRAFGALVALTGALTRGQASAAPVTPARVSHPPDASGPEFRRRRPQPLPAVYADWDIDPATRIITHLPTGLSFAVYRKPEIHGGDNLFARHVGGTPRTEDELAAVADMGLNWYLVFGSQMTSRRAS
jgi:hypothetical protein